MKLCRFVALSIITSKLLLAQASDTGFVDGIDDDNPVALATDHGRILPNLDPEIPLARCKNILFYQLKKQWDFCRGHCNIRFENKGAASVSKKVCNAFCTQIRTAGVCEACLVPPVEEPSPEPSPQPSPEPSSSANTDTNPTTSPTPSPSNKPTPSPSNKPTSSPSNKPTSSPSNKPTSSPSTKPTRSPSTKPTRSPSSKPTPSPSSKPTPSPSTKPTPSPTSKPTPSPTLQPTPSPTPQPTPSPTAPPSSFPVFPEFACDDGNGYNLKKIGDDGECQSECVPSSEVKYYLEVLGYEWGECPSPPICKNGFDGLGPAGKCAVLTLRSSKVSMSHGDPTGIFGTACIARYGELDRSGGQVVLGDVLAENPAKIKDGNYIKGDLDRNADLTEEKDAARTLAREISRLQCDVRLNKKPEGSSFNVNAGMNVICFDSGAEFQDDFELVANGTFDVFINVYGDLKVNGAKVTTAGGLQPNNLIWNVMNGDVKFSGGGGGQNCCKAELDGTVLAVNNKVSLSPGRVTGAIIASGDISLSSGSVVDCPKHPAVGR